ncbi:MAG: cytochrome c [Oceanicaulis sp.]
MLACAALLGGCGQRMIDQERQEAYEAETAALGRHPPEGTVARGEIARLQTLATRPEMSLALIERGRVVYDRVCALCHGRTGRGDGIIVARSFPAPPSYHSDRLKDMAPSYVVEVITNGYGVMYPYANRVVPEDRWAAAAYIQALQRLGAQVEPAAPEATSSDSQSRGRPQQPSLPGRNASGRNGIDRSETQASGEASP